MSEEVKEQEVKAQEAQEETSVVDKKKFKRPVSKKKVCAFCVDKTNVIDYKDGAKLRRYVTENGKILLGIANLEKDDNKFGIRLSYIDTENEQKKDEAFIAMITAPLNKDLTYTPTHEIAFLPQPEKAEATRQK